MGRPTAAQPDSDETAVVIDELVTLWPQLHQAIVRDRNTAPGGGPKRGGANPHAPLVNPDVSQALTEIAAGAADIAAEAERLLNLPPARRSTDVVLGHLADWHRSLAARDQPLAAHIATDVRRWQRMARSALHLDTRGRPFGKLCPHHRETAPTELLVEGDRAQLHAAYLRGARPAAGEAALTWQRGQAVYCPQQGCGAHWSGLLELRWLGKLIIEADVAS